MPRPKLSDEERKQRKQANSAKYYETHKEKWMPKKIVSGVYVISGLENDLVYVGVSKNITRREQRHRGVFGKNIECKVLLEFPDSINETYKMNDYENLIITGHFGKDKCLNKNNTWQTSKYPDLTGFDDKALAILKAACEKLGLNALAPVASVPPAEEDLKVELA